MDNANLDCPHFGVCGGCTFLDMCYADELAKKEAALRQILDTDAGLLHKITPAPTRTGYRNKMELAFGDSGIGSGLCLGIRKRRSYYEVVPISHCHLVPNDMKIIAAYVQDYFQGQTFFHRRRGTGTLRHLVLRHGTFTGEIIVAISTTTGFLANLHEFVRGMCALPLCGNIVGILHIKTDAVSDTIRQDDVQVLFGRDYFFEKLCGLTFKVHAFGFFQTNSHAAQLLFEEVLQTCATGGGTAYDLYCGTGTIGQILSPRFLHIVGVEHFPGSKAAAEHNAAQNNITNCTYIEADVLVGLRDLPHAPDLRDLPPPDVIILDPPRDGVSKKALNIIAAMGANIIYISCKPTSLVRDLEVLRAFGFSLAHIAGVDMFPLTPHVECYAVIERK